MFHKSNKANFKSIFYISYTKLFKLDEMLHSVLNKLVGNAHISPLPFCQFMQWWRREETACYVMTTFFQKQSLCDKVATITNFVWINYRLLIKFSILTQKFNL